MQERILAARTIIWKRCLAVIQEAYARHVHSGLVIMPPTVGEEEVVVNFVRWFKERNEGPVLIVVMHEDSAKRLYAALRDLGPAYLRLGEPTTAQLIIGTYGGMTSVNTKEFFDVHFAAVLFIDAERCFAPNARPIVEKLVGNSDYYWGIAASQYRYDKQSLLSLFHTLLINIPFSRAFEDGALQPFRYWICNDPLASNGELISPFGQMSFEKVVRGTQKDETRDLAILRIIKNRADMIADCRVLILAQNVPYAKDLVRLCKEGFEVEAVRIDTTEAKRGENLKRLQAGVVKFAVALTVTEDIKDLPFDIVGVLHATSSPLVALQQLLPVLSVRESSSEIPIVMDFVRNRQRLAELEATRKEHGEGVAEHQLSDRDIVYDRESYAAEVFHQPESTYKFEIEEVIGSPTAPDDIERRLITPNTLIRSWGTSSEGIVFVSFDKEVAKVGDEVLRRLHSEYVAFMVIDTSWLLMTMPDKLEECISAIAKAFESVGLIANFGKLTDKEGETVRDALIAEYLHAEPKDIEVIQTDKPSLPSALILHWEGKGTEYERSLIQVQFVGAEHLRVATEVISPILRSATGKAKLLPLGEDVLTLLPSREDFQSMLSELQMFLLEKGFTIKSEPFEDIEAVAKVFGEAKSAFDI